MFVFLNGVFILAFYLNGRMRDPSTALRVIVRGFGFVLMFVICLMAVVGDVCILGRSLDCARDDNGCCTLNLGVGLIYLIENYFSVYDYYSNIIWFFLLSFRLERSGMEKSFLGACFFKRSFDFSDLFNGRIWDPSTTLRVTVRWFGSGLIFVICVIAAVGDVCIWGRSLGCARDDDEGCTLNLGVGLIYLIENYWGWMIVILINFYFPHCHFDWSVAKWRNLFLGACFFKR